MKRFILTYTESGLTSSVFHPDNRKSNETIIREMIERAQRQVDYYNNCPIEADSNGFPRKKACPQLETHFEICIGSVLKPIPITQKIKLPSTKLTKIIIDRQFFKEKSDIADNWEDACFVEFSTITNAENVKRAEMMVEATAGLFENYHGSCSSGSLFKEDRNGKVYMSIRIAKNQ